MEISLNQSSPLKESVCTQEMQRKTRTEMCHRDVNVDTRVHVYTQTQTHTHSKDD